MSCPIARRCRAALPAGHALLLLCGAVLPAATPALAGEGEVFTAIVSADINRDDNVFRVPDNFNLLAFAGSSARGDTIRSTGLTLRFDKPIGRQNLLLEARARQIRYDRYDFLDHDRLDYTARLKWQLGNRLSGELYRERTQQLTDFGDWRSPTRNIRNQTDTGLNARWWLHADWYLTARRSRIESVNDTLLRRPNDNTAEIAEAGVLYRSGGNNEIGFVLRETDGDYPVSPAARYRLRNAELRGVWQVGGKSTLRGYVGRAERDHPLAPQRDYRGVNGRLSWDWAISGKTALNLTVRRELSAYHDFVTNYTVTDSISIAPSWRPTEKTGLILSLERSTRDFVGDINPLINYHRKDAQRSAALTGMWDPWRFLRLTASLRRDLRDSNDNAFDYKASGAYLGAQFTF
ncbi:MAG: hypothetical protein EFKGCFLK_02768 [Rhodocyclaceae bacterium]|nr:MAG: hypothetical protein F9K21_08790 [Rhodocyclaceae bacterium]MBE7421054.1 hypothetical protein [Zoogloeaceae bacterium]MBV6409139.1 hypothetical protein [Rhodocyclaceae bacterium]MCK6384189.1 hypothetical protein [Rhodocyclaceae bacterium]CAG0930861.1 hypothetical protein RHDC3_01661 [Rhodocyclaceae bacterium]